MRPIPSRPYLANSRRMYAEECAERMHTEATICRANKSHIGIGQDGAWVFGAMSRLFSVPPRVIGAAAHRVMDLLEWSRPLQIAPMVVRWVAIDMVDRVCWRGTCSEECLRDQRVDVAPNFRRAASQIDKVIPDKRSAICLEQSPWPRASSMQWYGINSATHAAKVRDFVVLRRTVRWAPFFDIVKRHRHGPILRGGVGGPVLLEQRGLAA